MLRLKLLDLLAQNKLEDLLDALSDKDTAISSDLEAKRAILAAQLKNIRQQEMEGTAERKEIEVSLNRLRKALSEFIDLYCLSPPTTSSSKRIGKKWQIPLLTLLIGLVIIAIGMFPTPNPVFEANLNVSATSLRITEPWPPNECIFDASSIEISNIKKITANPKWQFNTFNNSQPIFLFADSGEFRIGPFYSTDSTAIEFHLEGDRVAIAFVEESISGQLLLNSSTKKSWHWQPQPPSPLPSDTQLLFDWQLYPMGELYFTPDSLNILYRHPISAIRFEQKNTSNEQMIESTILDSSTIKIGDMPVKTLRKGDFFELNGLKQTEISISLSPSRSALKINLIGKAEELKAGLNSNNLASIRPYWLIYLYYDKNWYFISSVLIWVIGTIWNIIGPIKELLNFKKQ